MKYKFWLFIYNNVFLNRNFTIFCQVAELFKKSYETWQRIHMSPNTWSFLISFIPMMKIWEKNFHLKIGIFCRFHYRHLNSNFHLPRRARFSDKSRYRWKFHLNTLTSMTSKQSKERNSRLLRTRQQKHQKNYKS